ncbi:MAG: ATP-grasp domain-containing protein, partial [Deltaproteobacteria bacterium]
TFERSGATVINPNCVWVTVRDKLCCSETLAGAESFRLPRSFAVESADDVRRLVREHANLFANGYVLKPRIGWGGRGVQVADSGDEPRAIGGHYLLSERILTPRIDGRFWEARVFVMAGVYLGGLRHSSHSPLTNYWQGGTPGPLDDETTARLEQPALEAVRFLDAAADMIHRLPQPPDGPLTEVIYEGTGIRA